MIILGGQTCIEVPLPAEPSYWALENFFSYMYDCMCEHVCVCMYGYACVSMCVYGYACASMCVFGYACVNMCGWVCMGIPV